MEAHEELAGLQQAALLNVERLDPGSSRWMKLGFIVRSPHTNQLVAVFGCFKALGQMSHDVPDVVTVGVTGLVRLQLMQTRTWSGRRPRKCPFGTSESNSSRDEHNGILCMSGSIGPRVASVSSSKANRTRWLTGASMVMS